MAKDNITIETYEERHKNDCYAAVTYYINKDKKVVVCKIEPYSDYESFCSKPRSNDESYNYKSVFMKSFFDFCGDMNISFTGKAECCGDDIFDVEFGKKLAYDKAMIKLLTKKIKMISSDNDKISNFIKMNNELIEKLNKQLDNVSDRLEKKLKETI